MAKTPDIFLLGNLTPSLGEELRSAGYHVRSFKSTSAILKSIDKADILVIDSTHGGSITELKKNTGEVPKIVICKPGAARKISWVKEPYAYFLHDPAAGDLTAFVKRVASEAEALSKGKDMGQTIDALRTELDFFEEMHMIMSSSANLTDILPVILKQATKMTGAESWSVHLVNEMTGDLYCDQSAGRLMKLCNPSTSNIAAWTRKNKKPIRIENIAKSKLFGPGSSKSCKNRSVSVIAAPMVGKNATIGTIELLKSHTPFTEEQMEFLIKLANTAAIAMERISLLSKLEELSITDDLTNLFNTRYLNRSVENEINRCNRYRHSLSVIFMDVDYFKEVNDRHGHLIGSKVLVEMAEVLIRELRNIDIVARYGGDEFVMVLPQTTLDSALKIAERIRRAIEKHVFIKSARLNLKLTASFGVAAYPETASSKEDLMRIADESMYSVKKHTRNGVYAIIN